MMPSETSVSPSAGPDFFLEARDLSKRFGSFTALNSVSMGVLPGEFVSVLGPSGCGKTTLLRVIAGLEPQNDGTVWINGRNVSSEPVARRNMGIVFQSYALFPNITVLGNVRYGLKRLNATERNSRAMEMLDLVGLADQAEKYPAQLSGGQQQRVALARALAPSPNLLLLDEPLSALDARVRQRLRAEIRAIQKQLGVTTVMVTHDQEEALTMADRIMVMNQGRLVQFSPPQNIYETPADTFVAGFIGTMNFLPRCLRQGPARAGFLDYSLALNETAVSPKTATGTLTLGIRPEHIRVDPDPGPEANRVRTRICRIEFRGSVSRVLLHIQDRVGLPSPYFMEMEIQPKTVNRLNLHQKAHLDVHLPPRHLLAFYGNPGGPELLTLNTRTGMA